MQIFDIALYRSGLHDASQALHVGDNFKLDYLGARKAGWNSVWLSEKPEATQENQVQLDHVIGNFDHLLALPFINGAAPTVSHNHGIDSARGR